MTWSILITDGATWLPNAPPHWLSFIPPKHRTHEDVCPLNPTEVQQKIARGSQGVAVISGDELHLLLPGDLTQIDIPTGVDDGPAAAGGDIGVDIATVRPLLPPLINSAVVIARFLQKHDFDPAVVARFKVRRPGKNTAVAWSEFCHGLHPRTRPGCTRA
ncbi:hypothetical protein AB0D94_22660 [Streptomyces sp. NPDC048255]|uniref:hypothetical protein n=1 Tax=Streptomyces sp. NPDC048255 TaxID=3154713 RepID=UPI0033E48D5E